MSKNGMQLFQEYLKVFPEENKLYTYSTGCLVCSQVVGIQKWLTLLAPGFDCVPLLQSGQPKLLIFAFESVAPPHHILSQLKRLTTQLLSKSDIACEELEANYSVLCKTTRGKTNMNKSNSSDLC